MGCTRAVASLRVLVFTAGLVVACSSRVAPVDVEQTGSTTQGVVSNLTLFTTGVDNSNALLAIPPPPSVSSVDPHYSITASTDLARPAPENAIASTTNGGWASSGTTSRWISLDSTQCTGCASATYTYATTFSMPAGANPLTAAITMTVAADDDLVLSLNGTQVFSATGTYSAVQTVSIGPNQAAFTSGTNTLTFRVTNSGGGPTGLLVKTISGTASACTADSHCASNQFCDTNAQTCLAKLSNGTAIPTIAGHTPPLTGVCNASVGTAVCASGVCDTDNACGLVNGSSTTCSAAAQCRSNVCDTDSRCGFANGDGPCTSGNAGTVCRSGTCGSVSLLCVPSGGSGCASDADCNTATQFCNGSTFTCTAKLANSIALVNPDPLHANGTCVAGLNGQCTTGACDTDNVCGVANGDTCASGTVCRSGTCGSTLVCIPSGGCAVDADCGGARYCNTPNSTCTDRVANGGTIPTVPGHTPTIDGTCSPTTAVIVCASGACDGTVCGVNLGDGTCTDTSQCNSGVCVTSGLNTGKCEPCVADTTCSGGTPACNTTTNQCVTCTAGNASACTGSTPICNVLANTCAACNGDNGTAATLACPTAANPYCTAGGACGKCTGNADCVGLHAGLICDTTTGACGSACSVDGDCAASQWCNNPTATPFGGTCAGKIANGQPVPAGAPINGTCTAQVGTRVCTSGVCSVADNLCGEPNGVACSGASVCRSGVCNADGSCGDPNGTTCASATTCRSGICDTDGRCGFANGDGPCTSGGQCRSTVCTGSTCVSGDAGAPDGGDAGNDAGDAGNDGGADAGDAGRDAGADAGDAGRDGGADAGDAGRDGGADAGDAGKDGGADATVDSGNDASDGAPEDATADANDGASRDGASPSDGSTSDATTDGSTDPGELEGGGCSCRTAGSSGSPWASLGLVVLGAALLRRRARGGNA